MDYLRSGADADIWPDGDRGDDIPLYSQEYVSALLAELEAKDKRIAELERILDGVTPVMIAGGWTAKGISDYAKSLEAKLDEYRETTLLVRDEWQKDKARADEAEKRLDTPVRLPRPACTYADHSYPAYSRKQVEEIITSAGMCFTIEGDK
ncbi:hypothetical protein ACYZFV_15600 [Serratia ureilytica]